MLADVKAAGSRARWIDLGLEERPRGRILGREKLHVAEKLNHWVGSLETGELRAEHRLVGRRWWGVHRQKRLRLRSPLLRWSSRSSRCSQFPDWWNNTHPRSSAFGRKSGGEKKRRPSKALVPAFFGKIAVDDEGGGGGGG